MKVSLLTRTTFIFVLLSSCALPLCAVGVLFPADRCVEALRETRRARALALGGQDARARSLLRASLLACPSDPANLDQQAEVYDLLGDLGRAGNFRAQAMRLRGTRSKPEAKFVEPSLTIERGQAATLKWTTSYATVVELGPEFVRVPAAGSKSVNPISTTTYELRARGPGGETTATALVTVKLPSLSEANLLDLLKNGVPLSRIGQLAKERGISFDLTAASEDRLRAAGADHALLEILRKVPR